MRNDLIRFAIGLGLALALTFACFQIYGYLTGISTAPVAKADEFAYGK